MSNIVNQEVALLCGVNTIKNPDHNENNINKLVEHYLNGKYEDILMSNLANNLLRENTSEIADLVLLIKTNIESELKPGTDNLSIQLELLVIAAASLQLFIQNNWLGPFTSKTPEEFIHLKCTEKLTEKAKDELSVDGEPVYGLTRFLPYLFISHTILLECQGHFTSLHTSKWWLLRCLKIQQAVLDDKSTSIKSTVVELFKDIPKENPLFTEDKYRDIVIQFNVEVGHILHTYLEYKQARQCLNTAQQLAQLTIQIAGAMGKRTKYQEEDKAQLVLEVKRSEVKVGDVANESLPLPKNVALDDDTVLNKISFTDKTEQFSPQLTPLEQTIVLGCMESYRRSLASEKLTDEEVLTYLTCILDQLCNWNVGIYSLLIRSKLEKGSYRHVERSMMQLEELVNMITRPEPSFTARCQYFYSCPVPSIWNLKRELGLLLLSLGCISAAKDLYESLEMWEEAIACYQQMGKPDQAEVVVRAQLAKHETPNLYCFLGDVTRDIQWYQKAWELSNQKSARAVRCMGYLHFTKRDYEKTYSCFEKSLAINSLQIPVWFTFGCVALTMEKFEVAVKAFKRCVNIDSDNFEAWNNIASAYVKLKDKTKAFLTMKEAIKYNYESWQLWENQLIISVDCGEFQACINAYNRLLDLKEKWVDIEVLSILVNAVEKNVDDSKGFPARRHKPNLQTLFGRITSITTGNGDIWRLYAALTLIDNNPDNIDKGLQYLQRSHRCVTQTVNWEKEEKKCKDVSTHSIELAKLYIQCSEQLTDSTKKIQNLSSAKLMLKGILSKMKQYHVDPVTQVLPDSITELCTKMDSQLQDIVEKIDVLKNG